MKVGSTLLLNVAGGCMAIASLLHLAIIIGGADWYRAFGAGEEMALMHEQGAIYPALLTFIIAFVLALFSAYAFSGAGRIRKLPWLKPILFIISAILLVRGIGAIPVALMASTGYLAELGDALGFMWVTSIICIALGSCYLSGAIGVSKKLVQREPSN